MYLSRRYASHKTRPTFAEPLVKRVFTIYRFAFFLFIQQTLKIRLNKLTLSQRHMVWDTCSRTQVMKLKVRKLFNEDYLNLRYLT